MRIIYPNHIEQIFLPGGTDSVASLRKNGRALHWVREAFGHLKAIGAVGEAVDLARDACEVSGVQFSSSTNVEESYGVVTARETKPQSFEQAIKLAKGAQDFMDVYAYAIAQHRNYARELDGLASMVAF